MIFDGKNNLTLLSHTNLHLEVTKGQPKGGSTSTK